MHASTLFKAATLFSIAISSAHADYFESFARYHDFEPFQQDTNTNGAATSASSLGTGSFAFAQTITNSNDILLSINSSNVGNWTLGPFAKAGADFNFRVDSPNAINRLKFNFTVSGIWDLSVSHDHNTGSSLGIGLRSFGDNSGPWASVSGGVSSVNCLGCGGHLGDGIFNVDGGYAPSYSVITNANALEARYSNFSDTYVLESQFGNGVNNVGRLILEITSGVNSSSLAMSLRLSGISDELGNQWHMLSTPNGFVVSQVPLPGAWGLMFSAMLAFSGLRLRKQG